MKTKRILSVILALVLAVAMLPSAVLADSADDKIFDVIGLNISINEGQKITRYDLAKIAVSLGGLTVSDDGAATYVDVPEKHWAFPVVSAVTEYGYMGGLSDGSFMPDSEASIADAAQIFMNLLGYGYFGKQANWNTSDYLLKAKSIGLMAGTKASGTLDLATFKAMIKNMLFENVVTISSLGSEGAKYEISDMSYLQTRYGYYYKEGIMQAAGRSAIAGASAVNYGKVKVAGVTYNAQGVDYSKFLGYEVRVIIDKNEAGANLLYMEQVRSTEDQELYIPAANIDGYNNFKISYRDENGSSEQAEISMTSQIFLNGQKVSFDARYLEPLSGSIKLIDSDGNDVYDIINVTYEIFYEVSGAFENEYISDAITGNNLNIEDIEFNVYENGINSSIKAIKNEAVVAIMPGAVAFDANNVPYADNTTLNRAYVDIGTKEIKGVVSAKSVSSCIIDGVTYPYSNYFLRLVSAGIASLPTLNKEVKVYLNNAGEIVYAKLDAEAIAANRKYKYAYANVIAPAKGPDAGLIVQMFTQDGQMVRTETVKDFKFNGSKATATTVQADPTLFPGGTFSSQLVAFELDENGKVSALYTAVDNSATPGYEGFDLVNFNKEYDNSAAFYRNNFDHLYSSNEDSILFQIPADISDDESYVVKTGAGIFTREVTYDIELYDSDDKYNVGAAVIDYSKIGGGSALDARRDLQINHFYGIESFVVEEKTTVLNAKGEEVTEISGFTYEAPTGGAPSWLKKSLIATDDALPDTDGSSFGHIYSEFLGVKWEDLLPGDVIHFETDTNGEVERFRLVFRKSYLKDGSGNVVYKTLGGQTSTTYTVAGVIDKVFADGNFLFRDGEVRSVATLNKARPNSADLANVKIFIFENGKARQAAASELRPEEPAFFISESGNLYDVIVYRD